MAGATTTTSSADPTAPDPRGAAARVRERRQYKLSDEERERERLKKRRQAARRRGELDDEPEGDAEREPYQPNEASIGMWAGLLSLVWDLSTRLTGHRTLTPEEARRLGEKADPVAHKYLPAVNRFAEELELAGAAWETWRDTRPAREADAEVLEDGAPAPAGAEEPLAEA